MAKPVPELVTHATELCEKLLAGGAPGLHFYCMNQAALTTEICKRLKLA